MSELAARERWQADTLRSWRHEGDPLCDQVVRELDLRPGQDGLQKLVDRLESGKVEPDNCLQRFWDEVRSKCPSRRGVAHAPLIGISLTKSSDLSGTTSRRVSFPTPLASDTLDR